MRSLVLLLSIAASALAADLALMEKESAPEFSKRPGPHEVMFTRLDWKDEKRDREVPVKIYVPKTGQGPFPVILFSHGLGGDREGGRVPGPATATSACIYNTRAVTMPSGKGANSLWRTCAGPRRTPAMLSTGRSMSVSP